MRAVIREIIETIILSLLLFVGIQFAVQTYQVEGASMRPTLSQGQYLLVNKLVYRHLSVGSEAESAVKDGAFTQNGRIYPFHPPQHGEVVIFNFPNDPSRDFVKRVIGCPAIRSPRWTHLRQRRYRILLMTDEMDAFKVPTAMGDNRPHSNDSRDWGQNIVGNWPPHQIRLQNTPSATVKWTWCKSASS